MSSLAQAADLDYLAPVMRRSAALLGLSLALITACSESSGRLPPTRTEPATLERVEIRPSTAMLTRGATLALTADGVYSDGTRKSVTAAATWASATPEVVAVDEGGGVRAIAVGTAEIRATVDTKVGVATISVIGAPLVSLAIEPTTVSIDAGATTTLVARGTFADGVAEDVTSRVEWSSSTATVATVSAGRVQGVGGGAATIAVRDAGSGARALARVTVRPRLPTQVTVSPSGVVLPLGLTQAYTASARFPDGATEDVTRIVQWSSTNRGVATVDPTGLATTVGEGLTSITATFPQGTSGSVTLSVARAAVVSLRLSPVTATVASGQTQAYTAEAAYTDGSRRDLTFAVMWSSSDPSVARIGGADRNVATPVGTGTTTISALDPTSGASSTMFGTSARLRVLPPTLTGIVVTPNTVTVPFGAAQQFRANGLYSDASSRDLTALVTWSSSLPGVATIDTSGRAQSVAEGVTTIAATDPTTGVSSGTTPGGSAQLTVSPPALLSIAVTPSVWSMILGGTQQFTATGRFSDGTSRDLTSAVVWRSSGAAVTVSATGLATAVSAGVVTLSARDAATQISSDDTMASARVTASLAQLVSLALTPTSTSVPAGAEVQLRATGSYDNGATADLTEQVVWSVVTSSVADVGNAAGLRGRVLRTRPGSTRVSARDPGTGVSSGPQARVTVTPTPTLVSLALTPSPALVAVGRTIALSARGTYSDGRTHSLTNTVDWTSSDTSRATVGNTDGTRGRVTGVAVGVASIGAVYAATGLSAPLVALTVELGIITLSRGWPGPVVSIDATPEFGVAVGSVSFTAPEFGPNALVSDVNIAIDFLKTDGSCAAPAAGAAFHNETNLRLRGPTGASVVLAPSGTWSGGTAISQVTVTFDDQAPAAPSGTPVTGSYQPSAPLAGFNGTSPVGTWVLEAGDSGGGDPLCVYAYTITVTAQ